MNRDNFLQGMSHAASTVSVITTAGKHGREGVTVSAMCSVSADPPSLLVCVHHLSKACEALQKNGVLCVNVLREDQSFVSDTFAGRKTPPVEDDHFSCAEWVEGKSGVPMLADALVNFDCSVDHFSKFGSHFIFIARVDDIRYQQHGRALVYANRAYGRAIQIDDFVDSHGAGPSADALKLGCFVTLGPFFLPQLMASFLRQHQTKFDLYEGTQDRLLKGLSEKQFDVALTYDFGLDDAFDSKLLAEVSALVLLPAAHPLAKKAQVSLHELAEEPMVLLDILPSRDYFTSLFHELDLQPNVAFRSPSFEMVRGMVGNGLGYSILVSKPANAMSYDGSAIVTRPIKEKVTPGKMALVHRSDYEPTSAMRNFIQHTQDFFSRWAN
ncbi:MAG: flavin reductase [Pseudomonadota bacterium]